MHFSRKVGDHNACLPVLIQSESVSCFVVSDSVTPWTVVQQAPVSMGFSKQKYPSGLPFPSPGDLPNPGIEPGAPALQADSLLTELQGKPFVLYGSLISNSSKAECLLLNQIPISLSGNTASPDPAD